ncbi:antibiotic biosynthesis monooxygenase [Alkalihalobacillus alcalophilus ATCC 27647 = CGMCC 1.3604]|uniref:Antibiotic biosynthesis monooxygenase n=1 Tax=Alkalihalobacillus alcalophilus ATCC 27647 = CGMCC 1.3604 TaxID=1218173 RepID=A0A094WJG1_ALKAL|nr:antibiotic biosynthesis monooxygenase [Alkalihalobacillus alcalophilus]KGA96093.1 antibiotic biosynthesis monooxygenase [Alkalihalobacillus alcalophilus ATCC 27647 = CGMCC 1.3604]MED1561075.1 antibiotic biosynthesis monooxygenase [Alkalihalobacillus alcalophilus]THG90089.1 antibiotic biosynthesis monooxygenase [Alkalihalobacillus alcalophilus ATCC 27647 = CGMCC 1.3604]
MIVEAVFLFIKSGQEESFEQSFSEAAPIISSMNGYLSHRLQRCLETKGKYLLTVEWERLKDHTIGFRQSPEYLNWKEKLHHYYEPFPEVEHFTIIHS